MNVRNRNLWLFLASAGLITSTLMCGPVGAPAPTPTPTPSREPPSEPPGVVLTPTPTPTPHIVPGGPGGPSETPSPCCGLSGEIEVMVMVGPAAVVGLEPFSVGSIPFSISSEPPCVLQGSTHLSYADILVEEWGTYEVTFEMDVTASGECVDSSIAVTVEMSGSQLVVVDAPDFHGEYPWAGGHTLNLVFPLVDGATVEGEGYIFVLHLATEP